MPPPRWTNRKFFSKQSILILSLVALLGSGTVGPRPTHATSSSVNVIANPGFENGAGSNGIPVNWDFQTCEGATNATAGADPNQWAGGYYSAKVSTGPIIPVGCYPGTPCAPAPSGCPGRQVAFSQFRQFLPGLGYNFTQLTDSTAGLSFWFQLQPYNSNGMAAFEVRIFGAEDLAELDYVFNPDPSVGVFQNNTSTHSLLFNGYQYGHWYHFSRDLRADWMTSMGTANKPLALNYNFTLIQFEGLATQLGNSSTLKSETYWLDDVRVYVGTGPIPTENYYASFNFADANRNNANGLVAWTMTNSTGQTVSYTLGQATLPTGPYFVQAYYPTISPNYLILNQQLHLNASATIPLPLYPDNTIPGGHYIALNNPATSLNINRPDNTRMIVTTQGAIAAQYTMITFAASKPVLIERNGYDLIPGYDWTYDSSLSITRITFTMPAGGENLTIFFQLPPRIPILSFVDLAGSPLGTRITFNILDSQGRPIPYAPETILPSGSFFLEAYYGGFKVYRNNLANIGNPPVTLEMVPLDPSKDSYLAVNSTATSITPTENTSSQITFSIAGPGPYLVILNVPKRPLFVEKDGVRTPDWVYNSTSQTIAIETASPGTFQVVLDQPSSSGYLYPAGGAAGAVTIALVGWYFLRKRRIKPALAPQAFKTQTGL